MRNSNERGVTGLEIIVAIAIVLLVLAGLWWFFGGDDSEVAVCQAQLPQVRRSVEAWNATTSASDPVGDRILCTTTRDAVTRYNARCGEVAGALPVPKCD